MAGWGVRWEMTKGDAEASFGNGKQPTLVAAVEGQRGKASAGPGRTGRA